MNILLVNCEARLEQICQGIDWPRLGAEAVTTACSINKAKSLLKKQQIHLIICDVTTAGQRVLELFRWSQEINENMEYIVITDQSVFYFTQESLSMGKFHFLLWPVSQDEMAAAVGLAAERIRRTLQEQKALKDHLWETRDTRLSCLMQDYLEKPGADWQRFVSGVREEGLVVSEAASMRLVVMQLLEKQIGRVWWSRDLLRDRMNRFLEECREYWMGDAIAGRLSPRLYAMILQLGDDPDDRQQTSIKLHQYMHQYAADREHPLAYYASDPAPLDQLPGKWKLLQYMARSNVAGERKVFYEARGIVRPPAVEYPDMEYWKRLLRYGGVEQLRRLAHSYLDHFQAGGAYRVEELARFHQDFVRILLRAARGREELQKIIFTHYFDTYVGAYSDISDMRRLVDIVLDILVTDQKSREQNLPPIEKALLYINQNFDQKLDRREIADHVHISPEYLSRLFKKEMGVCLRDYVTQRKIQIAKVMLEDSEHPVYQIASRLGYDNFSHFSKVFKELCGETPQMYRKRKKKPSLRQENNK